ncbi:MAG: S24/S26 family peptidase [Synergistaceae bacterium]|nr:S24/S26 family peptidase [Synergistaceae bacterium]
MNSGTRAQLSIEAYLLENGTLTYTNKGTSMMPLLREGKDLFTVRRKGDERCKVGDVVLYRRPPDQYVLHRVVRVLDGEYVILGDNCTGLEHGITDDDIIGVMTGFTRSGREYSVSSVGYRLYTFMMTHAIRLRIFMRKALGWIMRRK